MKKLLFFVGILIALFIIYGLVQSIISLSQKSSVIEQARLELQKEEEKNKDLKRQLTKVKDPSFVEQEARNKLFLVKPNEQVVLIPSPSPTPIPESERQKTLQKPNWQEWYEYFL